MNSLHDLEDNINRNEYRNKHDNDDIQSKKILWKQHATIDPSNISIPDTAITDQSKKIKTMSNFTNMTLNESIAQVANMSNQIDRIDNALYLYGVPLLLFFCVISVAVNIKVLISVFWIRRPISPTLYISLNLAAADAFSSCVLGTGLIMNSWIPNGLEIELTGVDCFLLALKVVKLGGVIITVFHLMALAVNHYLGILRPLHYLSILTYKNTTILLVLLWVLPIYFFAVYFNLVEGEGFQSEECKEYTFLVHKKFRMLFSSLFFLPFGLMICIYIHIFYIVKKHQATRMRFRRIDFSIQERRAAEAMRNSLKKMTRNVKVVHTTLYILGRKERTV